MLSLLQFNIGMLQQFNICLFPSCSCVILAEKNSHLTLLVLRQAFARVIWSSGHSSLNILIWSREIWKPSNGDRKLCTWDFCHHCDLEGWKPGRYESQRQWNFVSRKLGVATFLSLSIVNIAEVDVLWNWWPLNLIIGCIAFGPFLEKGLLSLWHQKIWHSLTVDHRIWPRLMRNIVTLL